MMKRPLPRFWKRKRTATAPLCPELDIASQGAMLEEARDNLKEALTLFMETASAQEIEQR